MVISKIYKYSSLKIDVNILLYKERYLGEKAWDFIKPVLVITYVFVYIFEVRELFNDSFVDKAEDGHLIDVFKLFL